MNRLNHMAYNVAKSPFAWGILGAIGFYGLLHAGLLGHPLVKRYFAGHPVEYMETVLFAVAVAGLVLKALDIAAQRASLGDSPLGAAGLLPQSVDVCDALLAKLDRLPGRRQGEYYIRRLRAALEHVAQRGSADALDDELKYLADLDAARLQNSYGLFRVIVWAIPILGFLGTVIGITMALNGVDLHAPDESMLEVLNGLGVKFDTTALALTLAMALMFVQYFVERAEHALLEQVDRRAQRELSGRFAADGPQIDGQLAAVHRMAEAMRQTTEAMVRRQAELWRAAVDAGSLHWAQMVEGAAQQVQTAMSAAAGELGRRAEILQRAIDSAGEVARLEDALNKNLGALAGAKHFEQTVLALAAAVNMLSARLAETPSGAPIKLDSSRRSIHAA